MVSRRRLVTRGAVAALILALASLLAIAGPSIWNVAAYGPAVRAYGIEVRPKRWSWVPGPPLVVPVQPCSECQRDAHETCAHRMEQVTLLCHRSPVVPLTLEVGRTVTDDNASAVITGKTLELEGVEIAPADFRCPCCGGE